MQKGPQEALEVVEVGFGLIRHQPGVAAHGDEVGFAKRDEAAARFGLSHGRAPNQDGLVGVPEVGTTPECAFGRPPFAVAEIHAQYGLFGRGRQVRDVREIGNLGKPATPQGLEDPGPWLQKEGVIRPGMDLVELLENC